MEKLCYPAVLEPSRDGYSVYFPDVPGCTSGGATLPEALGNAESAIAATFALAQEHGESVPPPSSRKPPTLRPRDRVNWIPILPPGEVARITMSIDGGLLAKADELAADYGTTRSGLFAMLVRNELRARALGPGRRAKDAAAGSRVPSGRARRSRG